jgi:ribosomal protein S18 acetylase RimI-like enzyme
MVRIERANVADVPHIKQVLSETWLATYSAFLSAATIHTATSVWHSPQRLAAEIQHPHTFFGVAKTGDGTIIGLITVGQLTDDSVMLARLYVHPHYQHHGIGSQLLQAGISAFPTARTIRLEVEEHNHPAYTFYQHHGFHAIERKEERVESDVIQVVVMEKHLA